jgi:AcrR family transcriptional regulator
MPRTYRKPKGQYHHGDLARAMRQAAVQVVQASGVEALTLRDVSARLGVSRTAVYRHYASKAALLAAVAAEGFVMLRRDLASAWTGGDATDSRARFAAMGAAYVRFALAHPSHYRVMFAHVAPLDVAEQVDGESTDAFGVLVEAIRSQQRSGVIRPLDDTRRLALFVWAQVHGIAMLALSGLLQGPQAALDLMSFAHERLYSGIGGNGWSAAGELAVQRPGAAGRPPAGEPVDGGM